MVRLKNKSLTFIPALKTPLILILFVLAVAVASCDGYGKLLKSTNYELKLQKADEFYGTKSYGRSAQLYEELIPIYKGTDKSEGIYYRYVWSEYHVGDIILAQYYFKSYTRQFPDGPHVEECYFMNAYCYLLNSPNYQLDQTYTKNAIKEFQSFIDIFPDSKRIDTCNILIDQLRSKIERKDYEIIKQYHKLEDENWKAAIVAAKNFLKEYPSSTYNEEMYYLIIDSYYQLAVNSVPWKKEERLNGAIENYLKFEDLYPKSSYLSRAESIYHHCKRLKEKL
jgi:outer membrane protein assembly factor BamD